MQREELKSLNQLLEDAMYSSTKKEAQVYLNRLEFSANNLRSKVEPYAYNKLKEAINYAKQASGQASEKEHWVSSAQQSWFVFESEVSD